MPEIQEELKPTNTIFSEVLFKYDISLNFKN
jgi:hypothetical protein